MAKIKNALFVVIFIIILCLPSGLLFFGHYIGVYFDTTLEGVYVLQEFPEFSLSSVLDGSFQSGFSTWYDQHLKPRAAMIKTYSTINYSLFNLGNRPIGRNGNIFEDTYILNAIGNSNWHSMQTPGAEDNIRALVDELCEINEQLEAHSKQFIVYIIPDKGKVCYDDIPYHYRATRSDDLVLPSDYFRELMEQTDVPVMYFEDYVDSLEYPPYNNTGIHSSRTFDQTITHDVIEEINILTGRHYRNLVLGEALYSEHPFWREGDVFDLLGTWYRPTGDYYQYQMSREYPQEFDRMNILLCGDSFGLSFQHDLSICYPEENVNIVFYGSYVLDLQNHYTNLDNSYNSLDFQYYLDTCDVFIFEMNETNIMSFNGQYPSYLNSFLHSYVEMPVSSYIANNNYLEVLDASCSNEWLDSNVLGVYGFNDSNYSWASDNVSITLMDSSIEERGLELYLNVPTEIISSVGVPHIYIYVNGLLVDNCDLVPGENSIFINPENISNQDGLYYIQIYSDRTANGIIDQSVSYQIEYVGRWE